MKTYITPQIKTSRIASQTHMMAASQTGGSLQVNGRNNDDSINEYDLILWE